MALPVPGRGTRPVWAAVIAAVVLGLVAAITVMKGGKGPKPEAEPEPGPP